MISIKVLDSRVILVGVEILLAIPPPSLPPKYKLPSCLKWIEFDLWRF